MYMYGGQVIRSGPGATSLPGAGGRVTRSRRIGGGPAGRGAGAEAVRAGGLGNQRVPTRRCLIRRLTGVGSTVRRTTRSAPPGSGRFAPEAPVVLIGESAA